MLVRRYTGLTIEIRDFGLMDSSVCGYCGEALFDQILRKRKKRMRGPLLAAFLLAPLRLKQALSASLGISHWVLATLPRG